MRTRMTCTFPRGFLSRIHQELEAVKAWEWMDCKSFQLLGNVWKNPFAGTRFWVSHRADFWSCTRFSLGRPNMQFLTAGDLKLKCLNCLVSLKAGYRGSESWQATQYLEANVFYSWLYRRLVVVYCQYSIICCMFVCAVDLYR